MNTALEKTKTMKGWPCSVNASLLLMGLVLLSLFMSSTWVDPDLFHRVASGRFFVASGEVVAVDPFAFSPKKEIWIDHEWLAGVLFYLLAAAGGDGLLILFRAIVALASIALLSRAYTEYGGKRETLFLWLYVVALQSAFVWQSTVRSQVITYLFLPILLLAFAAHRSRGVHRYFWILPPMFWAWAQAHGGFVAGLGLFGCYCGMLVVLYPRESLVPLLSFLASFATTLISPYGASRFWSFIFHAAFMKRADISEWDPLWMEPSQLILPTFCMVLFVVGFIRRPSREQSIAVALLLVALYFGVKHGRLIAIFYMVFMVFGTGMAEKVLMPLYQKVRAGTRKRLVKTYVWCTPLLIFLFFGFSFSYSSLTTLSSRGYALGALHWFWEYGKGGDILLHFNHGSAALWRLYPKYQISLDSRYEEVYPDETVALVHAALNPRVVGHRTAFQQLDPDYVLLNEPEEKIREFLKVHDSWNIVYQDSAWTILGKEAPQPYTIPERRLLEQDLWNPRF